MAENQNKRARKKSKPEAEPEKPQDPLKPWGTKKRELPKYVMDSLYPIYHYLSKDARERVRLVMKIPIFIKDPLVALENPLVGIQQIELRLEVGMGDGPTSSRVAVVDFNADTQSLTDPVAWDGEVGWFRGAGQGEWLPDAPRDLSNVKDPERYRSEYQLFIEKAIQNPYFHQMNAWAVVQRVLEFYEEPWALGRPVPWGFDGNRLIVVPHAGYGNNAFYDQTSKSLQFYYFGDREKPGFTCLSHDVIAHETGHAILDGVRPMYNQLASVQTAAFHEFIGDLTAILLALFNDDIRQFVAKTTQGRLGEADILANIAPEFGEEVEGRPYLRTAFNPYTMHSDEIKKSLSPHNISQVMTGAMWDILTGIVAKHLEKNRLGEDEAEDMESLPDNAETEAVDSAGGEPAQSRRVVKPAQALYWAADRFRRVALQPLDLCPPCDIQFIDYARAVIRNDILTNPVDELGYRKIMLDVFHKRGLCTCGYQSDKDLPEDCLFQEALQEERRTDFVRHDIERVSRSRTAAYYFLSDNRRPLRIPPNQDVQVVDLYDNSKFGAAAERLPREVVLEYAWKEEVILANDPHNSLDFGQWNGKTFNMDCGGTLVFDGRGNLMSWFRKPGTQHITDAAEQNILARQKAWEDNPELAKQQKIKPPTLLERAELADLEIGRQRKAEMLRYLSAMVRRGLVGTSLADSHFSDGMQPVTAIEEGGVVRFETTPRLRENNFDEEEAGWTANY